MPKHALLWSQVEPSEIPGVLKPEGHVETVIVDSIVQIAVRIRLLLGVSPLDRTAAWAKRLAELHKSFKNWVGSFEDVREIKRLGQLPYVVLADVIAEEEAEARRRRPPIELPCDGHDGLIELYVPSTRAERKKLYRNLTAKPVKRRRKGPKPTDIAPLN